MNKILVAVIASIVLLPGVSQAASATAVPTCTIKATPTAITSTQSAVLTWNSTDGAIFASLDNNIGSVAPDGKLTVSPNKTTTYTFHSWNSRGEGNYCSVKVIVDGQGTIVGTATPTVTLEQVAFHPASAKVVLTSVPYTGAEDVLALFVSFALALSAWYAFTQRTHIFA